MGKMRQWLVCALLPVFAEVISGFCTLAWAQGQPLTFSAFGDIPEGGSDDYDILQQYVTDHNRYSPSAFIIHVGDILSSSSCGESKYADVAKIMKGFAVPAYIVVGDNEYTDCDNPAQGLAYWKKYFLNFEQNFCGAPLSEHQSVRDENFAFMWNGVLFVGINLVGGTVRDQNEWDTRMKDDADWVSQQFQAKVSQVRAAVVFAQTGKRSSVEWFTTQFRAAAAAFGKPVLYIHGDLHTYKFDQPWSEENITRLEVPLGNAEPPLQVTISMDTNPPEGTGMYTVKRNPWSGVEPYNMPPCANAGLDKTISTMSTTLQGSATDDGDSGSSLTTTWSKVSGPGTVTFDNTNALTTSASFSVNGIYILRLTANDGQLQKSDDVTIGVGTSINNTPIISSFTPTSGAVGTVVTIIGSNFFGATSVAFNGTTAGFTLNSDAQISATVPAGATTGKISVINSSGSSQSATDFTVTVSPSVPSIASFTPTSGAAGTVVTLTGSNFSGVTGVAFNGMTATSFTINSNTQISATVPAGATTGKITVSNSAGTGSSGNDFVVNTGGGSSSITFHPTDDAYVQSISAASNFGSATELRVELNSASDVSNIYFKFNVTGVSGTVQSAKLRLRCTDGSSAGGSVFSVSSNYPGTSNPWVEAGLNWNNAPAITGSALSTLGSVSSGTTYDLDVTAAVTGNGIYSFAIKSSSSNSAMYNSKEGAIRPELVVQANTALPPTQFTLTTNTVGSGSVSMNPIGGVYNSGTVVTLTAIPASGFQFSGWSGDLTGSTNPATITMNANKSVTATFASLPGAIAHEETRIGGVSNSTTVTTLGSLTGVSGHLYLAAISMRPKVSVLSVSGLGLSWTLVKSKCAGRNTTAIEVWMAQGTPTANDAVTATLASAPSTAVITVSRYSGVATSNPIVPQSGMAGNTNGVNASGACSGGVDNNSYSFNLTTTTNNAVVYAAIALKAITHTPGQSYTERAEVKQASGTNTSGVAVEDKTVASPATVTVNGSFDGVVDWAVVALEIKPPTSSPIVHEETRTGGSSSSTTVTTAASLTGVSGHLYLASISMRPKVSVSSISGLGLSWTLVKSKCAGRNTTALELWMAQGTPASSGTVTATFASAPSTAVIAVSRYSGVAASNPIGNVMAGNTNGLNGSGACSGGVDGNSYSFNLTTTTANAVVFSAAAIKGQTHTPGTGYTEHAEIQQLSGTNTSGVAIEDKLVSSVATATVNGSLGGATDWAMAAVEIKPQMALNKSGAMAANETAALPSVFQLEPNYPNPFNARTQIRFDLPSRLAGSHVTIKVYTINGIEVNTLVDAQYPAGRHAVVFKPKNLPSGTYFYVMQAGEARKVRQLMLVK